ncbi:MAG: PKD domain-containing protein, partial [Bacteroidota bacterium]
INTNLSCQDLGERNSSWYLIHITQSGQLCVSIEPDESTADFDYAIYDITGASFQSIRTDTFREIACNRAFLPGGCPNNTGPNGLTGGICGFDNQDCLPVEVGETYLLLANAYFPTSMGFAIDFSGSTASILPNNLALREASISPENFTQIEAALSFPVSCQDLTPQRFEVLGPGGPYTIQSLQGPNCDPGGNYESQFHLVVSPALDPAMLSKMKLVVKDTLHGMCGATLVHDTFGIRPELAILSSLQGPLCAGQTVRLSTAFSSIPGIRHVWLPSGDTLPRLDIALQGNTSVQVEVYDAGGQLLTTITRDISVLPSPEVSLGVDQTLCADSLQLSVQGGNTSYMWSTDQTDTAIWVSQSGTYWLNVVGSNGCENADTIEIDLDAPPIADFALVDSGLQIQFLNQSNDDRALEWIFGDGSGSNEENPLHTYATPGVYQVSLTLTNACGKNTITQSVAVNNPNAIDLARDARMTIFPQPASQNLSFQWKGEREGFLSVYDLQGKIMRTGEIYPQQILSWQVNYWPEGVYLLVFRQENKYLQQKIIIGY